MEKTITIGRTLDLHGQPIEGTGITLNDHGPTATLLRIQNNPVIFSNPITKEFGLVVTRDFKGNAVTKGLGIVPPGASGPPEHIHPSYEEEFEAVEGSFTLFLNKKAMKLKPGDKVLVPPGTTHTFCADGNTVSSFLVEARPNGRLNEVVHTIFGLAHDKKLDSKGRPGFWQGIALGKELSNDTLFTMPPVFVQKMMFRLFGNKASSRGYKAIYEEYMSDDFWRKRVEQIVN